MSANLRLSHWWLPAFIIVCYLVAAFGAQFSPGNWYEGLQRAPWNPPNAAFPIVWTVLYAMIAVAGWLIFSAQDTSLKLLWTAQLLLNGMWSWIFFGQHWVGIALLEIVVLVVVVLLLIKRSFDAKQTLAACLHGPYLVWLLLATSLNAYIVVFN